MSKFKPKLTLKVKFIAVFVLTVILLTCITGYLSYTKASADLDEQMGQKLENVAILTAMMIDGDEHSKLKTADDESSDFYKETQKALQQIQTDCNVFYVYTLVPTDDKGNLNTIVDPFTGKDHIPCGTTYNMGESAATDPAYAETVQKMNQAFLEGKPAHLDSIINTPEWGAYKSGFAPIKNSKGEVVALVEADMSADAIIAAKAGLLKRYYYAGIGGVIISIILSLAFAGYFVSPIKKMVKTMSDIADMNGDLTQEIKVKSSDEIGQLAFQFNRMLSNLRTLIAQIRYNVSEVAATSVELSRTATNSHQATEEIVSTIANTVQAVETGSSRQRESVSQAMAVMDRFSSTLQQTAESAHQQAEQIQRATIFTKDISSEIHQVAEKSATMAVSSTKTTEAAETGEKVINGTIKGMETVRRIVQEAASTIQELGGRSKQIGEIIQVIDDIAEQTNLLALNAAIEAARAGEHGKGFAVVADEVRKLAERSSRSTKEIGELISDITKGIDQSVTAMTKGTTEVEEGFALATEAGQALSQIFKLANEANMQTKQINDSTSKVASKTKEMVETMETVAAIVEENTAAATEMSSHSNQIKEMVDNIGSVSTESARAVKEVATSGQGMRRVADNLVKSSESLTRMSQSLEEMTAKFKLE